MAVAGTIFIAEAMPQMDTEHALTRRNCAPIEGMYADGVRLNGDVETLQVPLLDCGVCFLAVCARNYFTSLPTTQQVTQPLGHSHKRTLVSINETEKLNQHLSSRGVGARHEHI